MDPLILATVTHRTPAAGAIDQNVTHRLSRSREEVSSILKAPIPIPHQPQPCLVHQSRRLKCLAWRLPSHPTGCEPPKLVIDKVEKSRRGFGIALSDRIQHGRGFTHEIWRANPNSSNLDLRSNSSLRPIEHGRLSNLSSQIQDRGSQPPAVFPARPSPTLQGPRVPLRCAPFGIGPSRVPQSPRLEYKETDLSKPPKSVLRPPGIFPGDSPPALWCTGKTYMESGLFRESRQFRQAPLLSPNPPRTKEG